MITSADLLTEKAAPPERTGSPSAGPHVLHLPSPLASLRHSLPVLIEGVIGPFAVFYVLLLAAGVKGALVGGLAWCYLAIGRRLVQRERPPGTLLLGAAVLTARTVIAFATGSMLVYFLQPTLATALVALLFLVTAIVKRPLVEKLARDFCPLEPAVLSRPAVRRFFVQISVLWGGVLLSNAGVVLWLLLTSSLRSFVVERTAATWTLTALAIVWSAAWFVRSMRRDGLHVRWGRLGAGEELAPPAP